MGASVFAFELVCYPPTKTPKIWLLSEPKMLSTKRVAMCKHYVLLVGPMNGFQTISLFRYPLPETFAIVPLPNRSEPSFPSTNRTPSYAEST